MHQSKILRMSARFQDGFQIPEVSLLPRLHLLGAAELKSTLPLPHSSSALLREGGMHLVPESRGFIIEGSSEVKLPIIWAHEKQRRTSDEKIRDEKRREERSKSEKVRRKKMQVREKVGKSRHVFLPVCFVAPAGRKVGSLQRLARSQLAR